MKDNAKIELANKILAYLNDNDKDNIDLPIAIGELNKVIGLNGFKKAEIGTHVFLKGDRHIIYLESLDGKTNVIVPYIKETLKSCINFY